MFTCAHAGITTMPSKTTDTITVRLPNEVRAAILAAARAEGVSVSVWASRRLRNNLRRTGRLPVQTAAGQ